MLKIHIVWKHLKASKGHHTVLGKRTEVFDDRCHYGIVTASVTEHKVGFHHGDKAVLSFISSIISIWLYQRQWHQKNS